MDGHRAAAVQETKRNSQRKHVKFWRKVRGVYRQPLARSGHLIVNKKERVKVTEQEKKEMGHRRFYREQQPRWWC